MTMHEANYNKFMQNENLKQELRNTAGTTIAQASHFDRIGVQVILQQMKIVTNDTNGQEKIN